ncbi:MAG: tyrosine-type recombinase/integrase [Alphaproteobacteria bacterium]
MGLRRTMARTVKEEKLETRTARRSLGQRAEPYWRTIGRGAHIGYRRHKDGGGAWVARIRLENRKYIQQQIAITDDIEDADGIRVLNFTQAQEKARQWFSQITHKQAGQHYGPYTIEGAVSDYMAWFKTNRKTYQKTKVIVDAFILPEFGKFRVEKLTTHHIREWHEKRASTPARKSKDKDGNQQYHEADNSEEGLRKRKVTANRYLNIFKAILNKAYLDGKVASDDAWRRVKPFKKVDSARIGYFELDEIARLVNACPDDLRRLVSGALYTGCRYNELAKLTVRDFNTEVQQIYVRPSKNGKARHITLTAEAAQFFTQACLGKDANDLIFARADGSAWGRSYQQRPFTQAVRNANITKDVNFHSLRHTHASQLAMAGVEMLIIARQLGHSDTRMVEKHYAHLAPHYVTERIRDRFPALGINLTSNVMTLKAIHLS